MKKTVLASVACAGALFLSGCSAGSDGPETSQSTTAPGAGQSSATATGSAQPRAGRGAVVMTADLPQDIPVADEDGKIPGGEATSDVNRQTVEFGSYYQDAAGDDLSPVKWLVLDEKDGYSLLLSDQIVAAKGWVDSGREDITWAETDLRRWLDSEFFGTAFTAEEQGAIASYDVTQPQNPRYDTPAGEATVDRVSLLSYQELVTLMPTELERQAKPTARAVAQGCYENTDGDAAWWLRSPGPTPTVPEHLATWGNLGARTHYTDDDIIGVRPAIWVQTSSIAAA